MLLGLKPNRRRNVHEQHCRLNLDSLTSGNCVVVSNYHIGGTAGPEDLFNVFQNVLHIQKILC